MVSSNFSNLGRMKFNIIGCEILTGLSRFRISGIQYCVAENQLIVSSLVYSKNLRMGAIYSTEIRLTIKELRGYILRKKTLPIRTYNRIFICHSIV
jgi:hypothetical protein